MEILMSGGLIDRQRIAPTEDPFFILYAARSGSTFLANELTKRYRLLVTPETGFLTYMLGQYGHQTLESDAQLDTLVATVMADKKFADLEIEKDELRAILEVHLPLSQADVARIILDHYRSRCGLDGYRYGIKQGSYIHHYRDLLRLFPSAKFIGLVRDGRAVYNSQKHSINSDNQPMARDPRKAARRWVTMTKLLRELELDHAGVLIVNYETMIQETDATMAQIGAFLDAEPIDSLDMPRNYEIPERYGSELHRNINKAPLADRIEAWRKRLTKKEVADYESVARDLLVSEGYEPLTPAGSRLNWARFLS